MSTHDRRSTESEHHPTESSSLWDSKQFNPSFLEDLAETPSQNIRLEGRCSYQTRNWRLDDSVGSTMKRNRNSRLLLRLLFGAFCVCTIAPNANALDEQQTLALLVKTIQDTSDPETQTALLKGMLTGLEGRRDVPTPKGWAELGKTLRSANSDQVRALSGRLSQIFGDEQAIAEALKLLKDSQANTKDRARAFKGLVEQRRKELKPILSSLLEVPDLQLDAIRAFGVIENEDAAQILLSRYRSLGESQQRAIVETLATRKNYAIGLIGGLKEKVVPRDAIPSYLARSLRDLLGDQFTNVYGKIPEMKQNVKAMIKKYKGIITPKAMAQADASRGRAVFKKTCGNCHLMYGTGGKIGPDLTGSNRKNLDYFLLNSLDPSADVPEGYRMVLIQTEDGRVLNGVIAEENNQRIILKTVDQPQLVIAKEDIVNRKVSEKSMMPEGQLQQLKRRELFDLVRYLQTTEQVELPK